jgi:hypothetical protein
MIKFLFDIIWGNWCKHDWESIRENSFQQGESGGGYMYTNTYRHVLLKCKKCGALTRKTV